MAEAAESSAQGGGAAALSEWARQADGQLRPAIFVSIPSYRDPECQYTVLDLFKKAKYPERVYIGICWQADREEDKACFLLDLSEYESRVRTVFIHHSEARGPCYARALVQKQLFKGEDYYFQLDSHYRMIENWDEELISQLGRCPSSHSILTTYPSSYTLPDEYEPGQPDAARLHPGRNPIAVCAREFGAADGFLRTAGKAVREEALGGSPAPALFWAAGFAFSSSAVVREVPYDPTLEDLFFGEEPSMAARLWTGGWDFFAPTKVVGFHLWSRKHRPVFREHACDEQRRREAAAQARVRQLLGVAQASEEVAACGSSAPSSPAEYWLGSARSLADYEAFCGVAPLKRKISMRAKRGGLDASAFVDGDPAVPSTAGAAAVPPALAAMLGMPILGAMPNQVTEAIQGLVGPAGGDGPAGAAAAAKASGEAAVQLSPGPPQLLRPPEGREGELQLLRPEEVAELNRCGIVVLDRFLEERCWAAACSREAAAEAPLVVRAAALQVPVRPARLGREGGQLWSSTAVRGDEMAWLSAPQGEGLRERAEQRARRGLDRTASASSGAVGTTEGSCSEFDALSQRLRASFTGAAASAPAVSAAEDAEARSEAFYEDLDVLLAKVAELRDELDSTLDFCSTRLSIMLARYPAGGARYARHRDAHADQPPGSRRRLTMVYYLNPSWTPADGGCLRAHLPADLGPTVPRAAPVAEGGGTWALDVEPRLDRLVIFASEWLEHEVLPAHAERYAITAWLY